MTERNINLSDNKGLYSFGHSQSLSKNHPIKDHAGIMGGILTHDTSKSVGIHMIESGLINHSIHQAIKRSSESDRNAKTAFYFRAKSWAGHIGSSAACLWCP